MKSLKRLVVVVDARRDTNRLPNRFLSGSFLRGLGGGSHIGRDSSCGEVICTRESGRIPENIALQLQGIQLSNAEFLVLNCTVDLNQKLFDGLAIEVPIQDSDDTDVRHQRVGHHTGVLAGFANIGRLCGKNRIVRPRVDAAPDVRLDEQLLLARQDTILLRGFDFLQR